MQTLAWPGSGSRQVQCSYRGTSSYIRIYGANTGDTIHNYFGSNTMTLLATINNSGNSSWSTHSQSVNLTGTCDYLVIHLHAGDFDKVTLSP